MLILNIYIAYFIYHIYACSFNQDLEMHDVSASVLKTVCFISSWKYQKVVVFVLFGRN